MRKLSLGEQALVSKLIANSTDPVANFPIKILESFFQDNKVTFHADDEPYFNFFVSEGKEDSVKELTKRVYDKVLEAVNLVDYLKAEHMLFEMTSTRDKKVFGDDVGYVSAGLVEVRVFIEEDMVASKLKNFLNNAVYVAETLKDLQNDNFVTFEEKVLADTKSLNKKARNAVIVAILAVLVAGAGVVLSQNAGGKSAGDCPMKQTMEAIQGSLDSKILPAITEVKTEVTGVKDAVNNMDADPVNLSDLQKSSEEPPKADKKKSKKKKRK